MIYDKILPGDWDTIVNTEEEDFPAALTEKYNKLFGWFYKPVVWLVKNYLRFSDKYSGWSLRDRGGYIRGWVVMAQKANHAELGMCFHPSIRGKGHARDFMNYVIAEFDTNTTYIIEPDTESLRDWYKTFGFVQLTDQHMVYEGEESNE